MYHWLGARRKLRYKPFLSDLEGPAWSVTAISTSVGLVSGVEGTGLASTAVSCVDILKSMLSNASGSDELSPS